MSKVENTSSNLHDFQGDVARYFLVTNELEPIHKLEKVHLSESLIDSD